MLAYMGWHEAACNEASSQSLRWGRRKKDLLLPLVPSPVSYYILRTGVCCVPVLLSSSHSSGAEEEWFPSHFLGNTPSFYHRIVRTPQLSVFFTQGKKCLSQVTQASFLTDGGWSLIKEFRKSPPDSMTYFLKLLFSFTILFESQKLNINLIFLSALHVNCFEQCLAPSKQSVFSFYNKSLNLLLRLVGVLCKLGKICARKSKREISCW